MARVVGNRNGRGGRGRGRRIGCGRGFALHRLLALPALLALALLCSGNGIARIWRKVFIGGGSALLCLACLLALALPARLGCGTWPLDPAGLCIADAATRRRFD